MSEMELNDLLELVKDGDELAFQELYRRFYKKTYYAALKISGNQADAKDITQETFIQVNKSLPHLNDNKLFVQWLNRIVASKASDLFRKNKTTSLPDDHVVFQLKEEERSQFIPEAKMHISSDYALLEYFLKQMDERYRMVLVLRYFSQMSVMEIANALQVPDGTVKTRLKRGREVLRMMIEQYQNNEGVELNFRSADMAVLLSGLFMSEYASLSVSVPAWGSVHLTFGRKLMRFTALSSAVALCCAGLYGGAIIFREHHQPKEEVVGDFDQKKPFGPVTYRNGQYNNAEEAFYTLTLFAHCEVEMKEKTAEEIREIVPLYEELKRYGGVYWELLKFREWNIDFEKVLNAM